MNDLEGNGKGYLEGKGSYSSKFIIINRNNKVDCLALDAGGWDLAALEFQVPGFCGDAEAGILSSTPATSRVWWCQPCCGFAQCPE